MRYSRRLAGSRGLEIGRRIVRQLSNDLPIVSKTGAQSMPTLAYIRCLDLFRSVVRLIEAGYEDVAGVVHRSLLEAGFVALYLQGGEPRFEALMRADFAEMASLRRRAGAPPPDWDAFWNRYAAFGSKPNVPSRTQDRLQTLTMIDQVLDDRKGSPYEPLLKQFRDNYRLEAHHSDHASVSSVEAHARRTNGLIEVGDEPFTDDPLDPVRQLIDAIHLIVTLAEFVYGTFDDLDQGKVRGLQARMNELLSDMTEGSAPSRRRGV